MLFGLAGASRSGKTTLGRAVADQLGIAFHATSTAKVVEALGIDLTKPMTHRDRLNLQLAILENFCSETQDFTGPTIVDRTPLDMIAYTFAEFGMASHRDADENTLAAAVRYAALCQEHTRDEFAMVLAVRPLSDYAEDANKPAANSVYHAHYQMILEGNLSFLHSDLAYAVIATEDHDRRVHHAATLIQAHMDGMVSTVSGATLH